MVRKLRAVGDDEKPARPLTLDEAIAAGDYLEILRAQRRAMAASIPDEKGPALAALHRQLALVSKEIAALELKDAEDVGGGADVDDEEFRAEAL